MLSAEHKAEGTAIHLSTFHLRARKLDWEAARYCWQCSFTSGTFIAAPQYRDSNPSRLGGNQERFLSTMLGNPTSWFILLSVAHLVTFLKKLVILE